MNKQNECSTCSQNFTITNYAWIISICTHNICNQCYKSLLNNYQHSITCLKCQQKYQTDHDTIQGFPKNIMILKRLKNQGQASKESSMLLSQFSQVSVGESGKQKLVQTKEINGKINEEAVGKKTGGTCAKHGRILQIVCCWDGKVMCSHCALFGECKGHKFKTLKDFQAEFSDYKKKAGEIFERRKNVEEKCGGKGIEQKIGQSIQQKHKAIQKQIHAFINAFINDLRQLQNRMYLKVQEIFGELSRQAKQSYLQLFNGSCASMYCMWEKETVGKIGLIQGQRDISSQISQYYGIPEDHLGTGIELISKIQGEYENVYKYLSDKINGVKLFIGDELIQKIEKQMKIICDNSNNKNYFQIGIDNGQINQIKKSVKIQFVKSSGSSKELGIGKTIDVMKKTQKNTKSNSKIVNSNNLSPAKNIKIINKSPRAPTSH